MFSRRATPDGEQYCGRRFHAHVQAGAEVLEAQLHRHEAHSLQTGG